MRWNQGGRRASANTDLDARERFSRGKRGEWGTHPPSPPPPRRRGPAARAPNASARSCGPTGGRREEIRVVRKPAERATKLEQLFGMKFAAPDEK